MARVLVGLALGLAALAAGCSAVSLPPTYTPAELELTCHRTGGWWRGDLIAGYCEYQAPGFL